MNMADFLGEAEDQQAPVRVQLGYMIGVTGIPEVGDGVVSIFPEDGTPYVVPIDKILWARYAE